MRDIRVFFDSMNTACKEPAGTMRSGEALTLRLFLDRRLAVRSAKAVVRYDRHDLPAYYEMHLSDVPGDLARYEVRFDIEDRGLYWYSFEVETEDDLLRIGRSEYTGQATLQLDPCCWQETVTRREYEEPDWICGGVYYHIFVDRFCHAGERVEQKGKITRTDWGALPKYLPERGKIYNNDFFGGNLAGIREKLPYLEDLGVTCLYLSPIFEAYSNHTYDTGDYRTIDPMFGTEEDFIALCREAEARGMRIILDGVFAHTGSDSIYFNKYGHYGDGGAYRDPESPYRDWYSFHEDGSYDTWWGIRTLPRINKDDLTYREFINGPDGIVRHWLRKGASGWRLDVVDEFPSDFLEELVRAAKEEKPDALIIGEVWEDASNKVAYDERKNYFEGDKLDSVMNYPVKDALIDYVRYGSARVLAAQVETILEHYPPEAVNALMNLLGTHDSIRAITALAGKRLPIDFHTRIEQAETHLSEGERALGVRRMKLASLLQMTLPGVPCIYYGDEAGMEGYADPFNRQCYPWGHEDIGLREWYRSLIRIRKAHKVYRKGGYRTIAAEGGLYAFLRYDADGAAPAMMTVENTGDEPKLLETDGCWRDVFSGQMISGTLTVQPDGMYLLEQA
ncbi:MAG: glycoside hydrolase family 13 protein [Mogibacterium sp.]|nr:glycoside hydrolase family 13 protein [Mogibacterium sp.]